MKELIQKYNISAMPKNTIKMVNVKTTSLYKKSPKIFIGVLLLLIGGGAFVYFKGTEAKAETYIVARGQIEEAVSVTGKIKASVDASLSFEKGGTVSAVYVKEGQKVRAGQTLMTLSGGADYGQVLEAQAQVQSAEAGLDQLKNGTRKEQVAVSEAGLGSAKTALNNAYASVGDSIRSSYNSASDAVYYKTQNFFTGSATEGYRTNFTTCNSSLENTAGTQRKQVESDLKAWSRIDTTTMSQEQKESALLEVQGYIARTSNLIELMSSIVNAQCASSNTSLDTTRAAVSTARTSIIAAQTEITTKRNAIASAKSSIAVSESDLALTQAGAESDKIKIQEAAVKQAYARLYQAQAANSKNVITAPGSGLVTKVDISAGEYATPGKVVARIVGTGDFTVEADVTESDIARIVLDNTAKVVVTAIDAKTSFEGTVVSIDPAERSDTGNPLYRIIISLKDNDPRIKSGMTAETTIQTNVVNNLVRIPTRFQTKVKGITKVQVVTDTKSLSSEEREIKTGRRSTDGYTEIVSGVEEGEILVLPKAVVN